MNTPTFYTLGTASKALGVTKPTVRKWIDDGELSATKNEKGHFQIQRADLERLYPEKLHEVETRRQTDSKDDTKTLHPLPPQNDTALQAVIDAHKAVIEEKDKRLSDYEKRLERTEHLLEDKRTDAVKAQSALDAEKAQRPKIKPRKVSLWDVIKNGGAVEVNEVVEVA